MRQPAELLLRRREHRDRLDAGHLRRHHVHHHAGRVDRQPAGHVQPDPADRDLALGDRHPPRDLESRRRRRCASCTMRARRIDSTSAARRSGVERGRARRPAPARARGAGQVDPVEAQGGLAHRGRAASRTSSQMGLITSTAAAMSSPALGRVVASSSLVRVAAGRLGDRSWKAPAQSTEPVPPSRWRPHRGQAGGQASGQSRGQAPSGSSLAASRRSRNTPTATMPPAARPGRQRPERDGATAAQDQRVLQMRSGWQGGQQVAIVGQPDPLADPQRDHARAHRADQDGGHAGRAVPAHREPVAEQPGRRPADQGNQGVPAVRGDERGGLHVDHGSAAAPGHDQQRARRQQRPGEPGRRPEHDRAGRSGQAGGYRAPEADHGDGDRVTDRAAAQETVTRGASGAGGQESGESGPGGRPGRGPVLSWPAARRVRRTRRLRHYALKRS